MHMRLYDFTVYTFTSDRNLIFLFTYFCCTNIRIIDFDFNIIVVVCLSMTPWELYRLHDDYELAMFVNIIYISKRPGRI